MYGKVCINITATLLLALLVNPSGLRADATSPTRAGTVSPSNTFFDNLAPSRKHSPAFKSKVALAAIKGDKTITELSR